MNILKNIIITTIVIFYSFLPVFPQNNNILDSIKSEIKFERHDTLTVKNLIFVGDQYYYDDIDSAIFYYEKALNLSLQLNTSKFIAKSYSYLGYAYIDIGAFDVAIDYINKAISQYLQMDKTQNQKFIIEKGLAECYNNLGIIYKEDAKYEKAIDYFLKTLEKYEELNLIIGVANSYGNIANIFSIQLLYDKALDYYEKALKKYEEVNYYRGISLVLNNVGVIYKNKADYKKAAEYFNKAIVLAKNMNDNSGVSLAYINLGTVWMESGNYNEANACYEKALKIEEEINNQVGMCSVMGCFAELRIKEKRFNDAKIFAEKELAIAQKTGILLDINNSYENLSLAYEGLHDYKKSLEFHKIHKEITDSIFDKENSEQIKRIESRFQVEKKQLQIDNLNKENDLKATKLANSENQRQKQLLLIYTFIFGFIIILIFAIIIYRMFIQKKKANNLLASQNIEINQQKEEIEAQRDEISKHRDLVLYQKEEIEDSINYAKRIQNAVLPSFENLQMILGEHFILFKPKDIVSGDFYWATIFKQWQIIAVADCTGHGVPGAFMSMLGISFLNEIVRKDEIVSSNQILNVLRKQIIESLQQRGVLGEQKDGMDISLCVINLETQQMQFSGANNPLYIVKNKELIEIKGDKMPIAIYENMYDFTRHDYQLENGDCIYLFSDGYADQFGGPNGKKFMYKNFKEILISNSHLTMEEQKSVIENKLITWMGNLEQIDDITVLGMKI